MDLPLTQEWESHSSGEFCSGSAPLSGVGVPKFGMVLVWVCPSLRSGCPKIWETFVCLPLTQEWVPLGL